MKQLRWLHEEPKSGAFFVFLFFYHILTFVSSWGRSTKGARNCEGYGRKKLPPSPTYRRGDGNCGGQKPWSKTCTKRPGVEKLQQNIHETRDQKNASTEYPMKNPTVRKTKNTQFVEEASEKTHPPQRLLMIPNHKYHQTTTILEGKCTGAI